MTPTDRVHKATGEIQRLFDSYREGQRTIQRAAAHCRMIADALEDVAYWADEALIDREMTVGQHREALRDAAIANMMMASAMLAVLA